jgi:pyrimidine-nucleoside phosphorylase
MVTAQGGYLEYDAPVYGLPEAAIKVDVPAWMDGYISDINGLGIGRSAMLLGAGRERIEDRIDPAAGVHLIKKKGDYVKVGDTLAVLHTNDTERISLALPVLKACFHFSPDNVTLSPIIIETIK